MSVSCRLLSKQRRIDSLQRQNRVGKNLLHVEVYGSDSLDSVSIYLLPL